MHHCIVRLLEQLKIVLARSKFVSLEFKTEKMLRRMSVRLWEGIRLLAICLMRCGRDVPLVTQQLMVEKFLGVVSEKPHEV